MARAIVIVLDSFGIGASEDAHEFGDQGANTLLHIAQACIRGKCQQGRSGALTLPNLTRLGLAEACRISCKQYPPGFDLNLPVTGAWGYAQEISSGKDTPSGHWEMAGVPVLFDWGYFEDKQQSFPSELVQSIIQQGKVPGILANCHAPGTEVINRFAEQHIQTGQPICYTSADSVFQIAAHEQHFGLERLYQLCETVRQLLEPYNIGRVIARPFVGSLQTGFERTGNRRDYALPPPAPTVLDKLQQAGGEVISVGKIADIFAHQGITQKYKAHGLEDLLQQTLDQINNAGDNSLIFTNLVDFDTLYGHRRDINGYAKELEQFDQALPTLLNAMSPEDLLILTADHGCDPSWPGTDHTREHIPVLAYGYGVKPGSIGARTTFADIGQSLAQLFNLSPMDYGKSFLQQD